MVFLKASYVDLPEHNTNFMGGVRPKSPEMWGYGENRRPDQRNTPPEHGLRKILADLL